MLAFLADTLSLFIGVLSALFEAVVSFFWPPPPKDLSGETAVVTGAGHGIGRELALQLAEMGVRVVCWDICQETCQKTADEANAIFKGSTKKGSKVAWAVKCDVSKREDVRRAVEDTRYVYTSKIIISPKFLLMSSSLPKVFGRRLCYDALQ